MNNFVTLWAPGSKSFISFSFISAQTLRGASIKVIIALRSDSLSNLNRHGHYDRLILLLLFVAFIAPATLEIAFELPGIAWRWRR